ncbi:hypothetical protein [uncultured Pelagimonas sp.]|uniref:hypothetical protein n=1 Tax=uncultured Pelagimonas sp. TaxID=1618102 RepID=UPI002611C725|nr:hypothetical protein [uncultured Pelagimonas sp.]
MAAFIGMGGQIRESVHHEPHRPKPSPSGKAKRPKAKAQRQARKTARKNRK